jgi:hypothetical protein
MEHVKIVPIPKQPNQSINAYKTAEFSAWLGSSDAE